jgi:hypothetical protein
MNKSYATESAIEIGAVVNKPRGTPSSEVGSTATSHEIRAVLHEAKYIGVQRQILHPSFDSYS